MTQIYYKGELIATHNRSFGRNQSVYHLEHYLPLLDVRKRAILDAAPVKQNVPPEVLAELRKNRGDYSRMVEILHEFVDSNKAPTIKDPVKVISVDLSQYDRLGLGREVNQI